MELVSGFRLLVQQTMALMRKNFILSKRNRRSTFFQLFSSFFFMALLFGIKKTTELQSKQPSVMNADPDPEPITSFPIPPCESKMFIRRPCLDFVWSGNGNKRVESIVNQIMANNPGRPIPPDKVKSFQTKEEVYQWLMKNPMRAPGVLHFTETNRTEIKYGVQTNSSSYFRVGRQYEDRTFKYQIPLQFAASREIARSLLQDPDFVWDVSLTEFAHPTINTSKIMSEGAMISFAQMFLFAASMFGSIFQISSLVQEKELKLRQAMTMMGLYDTAYWCSWLVWEGFLAFLSSFFIVAFGLIFQIHLFTENHFLVVFLLFFCFQLSMVGFAFFLSVFISKSSSTTTVGFSIFVIGFMTMIFSPLFYEGNNVKMLYRILWSLFPPNPFTAALQMLVDSASQGGLRLSDVSKCPSDYGTCYSISYFLNWLGASFLMWFVLALYLDNIIPNSAGVIKPVFYFLKPGYWTGKGDEKFKDETIRQGRSTPDDRGVSQEENTIKQIQEGLVDPDVAVQLRGLVKIYSKSTNIKCHSCCLCCCYCSFRQTKPFDAIKGLWINFAKDQLFCLLGPNGAGKTTAIGCLTGIIPMTRGDALIYGESVRNPASMSKIRRMTGVCSQFDTLWNKLSGREHLELFACIKGLPSAICKLEAEKLLADVKLTEAAQVRSGSYSGGMKRRLSVAIALIGNPKLLILDEPTTGMDPITRRHVWDVIEAAKQGRSIILTTHSMEEADILSDRIGIMAKGRLRCIGTSTMLKSKFGTGFVVKVRFSDTGNGIAAQSDAVKRFFRQRLNVSPVEENKSLTFAISMQKDGLEDFFKALEDREAEFGIANIQIGLATLEQVFLNIAGEAQLENASAVVPSH